MAHTRDRLAEEMKWYDDYLDAGGVDRDANPTPGNKKGGLACDIQNQVEDLGADLGDGRFAGGNRPC